MPVRRVRAGRLFPAPAGAKQSLGGNEMRWVVVIALACTMLLGLGGSASAKKVPCKKIKEAVASGKTAEQAAAELGTRVKRVEACLAGKNKKKAAAAAGAPVAADEGEDAEE